MFFVDTVIVGVWVVVVAGIVVVVVNCVEIYRCTEQKYLQRFQLLNFVQTVNSAVLAELLFGWTDIFQTCLIWPSINGSVTIHPRVHNQTKMNMDKHFGLKNCCCCRCCSCFRVYLLCVVLRICVDDVVSMT